jgi:hypothetical protein
VKRAERGKRVQIYLPADLLGRWERTPRYERSATVAAALRMYWGGAKDTGSNTDPLDEGDKPAHIPE